MIKEKCKANTMMKWRCSRPAIFCGYCKLHYDINIKSEAVKQIEKHFKERIIKLISIYENQENNKILIKKIKEMSILDKPLR